MGRELFFFSVYKFELYLHQRRLREALFHPVVFYIKGILHIIWRIIILLYFCNARRKGAAVPPWLFLWYKPIRIIGRFLSPQAFPFSSFLSSFYLIFHILCVYLHRQAKARGRCLLPPVASRFDSYFFHHYLVVFDNDYNFNLHRFLSNWLVSVFNIMGFTLLKNSANFSINHPIITLKRMSLFEF